MLDSKRFPAAYYIHAVYGGEARVSSPFTVTFSRSQMIAFRAENNRIYWGAGGPLLGPLDVRSFGFGFEWCYHPKTQKII